MLKKSAMRQKGKSRKGFILTERPASGCKTIHVNITSLSI